MDLENLSKKAKKRLRQAERKNHPEGTPDNVVLSAAVERANAVAASKAMFDAQQHQFNNEKEALDKVIKVDLSSQLGYLREVVLTLGELMELDAKKVYEGVDLGSFEELQNATSVLQNLKETGINIDATLKTVPLTDLRQLVVKISDDLKKQLPPPPPPTPEAPASTAIVLEPADTTGTFIYRLDEPPKVVSSRLKYFKGWLQYEDMPKEEKCFLVFDDLHQARQIYLNSKEGAEYNVFDATHILHDKKKNVYLVCIKKFVSLDEADSEFVAARMSPRVFDPRHQSHDEVHGFPKPIIQKHVKALVQTAIGCRNKKLWCSYFDKEEAYGWDPDTSTVKIIMLDKSLTGKEGIESYRKDLEVLMDGISKHFIKEPDAHGDKAKGFKGKHLDEWKARQRFFDSIKNHKISPKDYLVMILHHPFLKSTREEVLKFFNDLYLIKHSGYSDLLYLGRSYLKYVYDMDTTYAVKFPNTSWVKTPATWGPNFQSTYVFNSKIRYVPTKWLSLVDFIRNAYVHHESTANQTKVPFTPGKILEDVQKHWEGFLELSHEILFQ